MTIEIRSGKGRVQQFPLDSGIVVFPMTMVPFHGLLAEAAVARNPYIEHPPPKTPMTATPLLTPESINYDDVTAALRSIAVQPSLWRGDVIARLASQANSPLPPASRLPTAAEIIATPLALIQAVKAFAMGEPIIMPRTRLMADNRYAAIVSAFIKGTPEAWTLKTLALGLGAGGLTDAAAHSVVQAHTAMTVLTTSGGLLASGYFNTTPRADGEDAQQKDMRDNSKRAVRLATFFNWAGTRYFDAALRPLLWYMLDPTVQERLARRLLPEQLEAFGNRARSVLDRPTAPWLAEGLRFFAPAPRHSSIGRAQTYGMWAQLMGPTPAWQPNDLAALNIHKDVKDALDPALLFPLLYQVLIDYAEQIRLWEKVGDLVGLEAAVGAVRVGSPIESWLWGPELPIVHVSPLSATGLPRDPLELLTSFTLPAAYQPPGSTDLPGRYESMDERTVRIVGGQSAAMNGALRASPLISIEPDDREMYLGADMLGTTPPWHLQWAVPPMYNGEPEALLLPPTVDAVAAFLGLLPSELRSEVMANPPAWQHIIALVGPPGKETLDVAQGATSNLVYSPVTRRQPWQRMISIPRVAPGYSVTIDAGTPSLTAPVALRIGYDPEPVVVGVPVQSVVDAIIQMATAPFLR